MIQLQIEIAKKKKNKFFSWLSKLFGSNSDLSNDKNIDNNNNNNKSLRKRIKSSFTRKASSKQTQQTNDDLNDSEPTFDQTSSQ